MSGNQDPIRYNGASLGMVIGPRIGRWILLLFWEEIMNVKPSASRVRDMQPLESLNEGSLVLVFLVIELQEKNWRAHGEK